MSEVIKTYIQKEAEKLLCIYKDISEEEDINLIKLINWDFFSGTRVGLSSGIELAKELVMYLTGYGEEKAKLFIENHINQKEGK